MVNQNQSLYHQGLRNISTLDGREILFTEPLREFLSESALHAYRAKIQIENLIALSEAGLRDFPKISHKQKKILRNILKNDSFESCHVADYDHFGRNNMGPFEHDVKSVEVYLREKFDQVNLTHLKEFIHFPMTSEDANNLAWNLMLRESLNKVWLPKMLEVCDKLEIFTESYAHVPLLGKTHGMNASPTTFGKRFAYFLGHFTNILKQLQTLELSGKYSGPVGNHNAMTAVVPEFDMDSYAKSFVESFGFRYEPIENQRNSHIEVVRLLGEINLANTIALDLCEHIRHSAMMHWLYQEGSKSHVGSSVMPHKINPWFFEVAEGYFEQSIAIIDAAKRGLIPSVFERDLTDHPWERTYGEMLGKSLIGLSYISNGFDTLRIDVEYALKELRATPEILTEAVQIAGRLKGSSNIYMVIKDLSRGQALTLKTLHQIIDGNIGDKKTRNLLKALTPESYTGKAAQIANLAVKKYRDLRASFRRGILHKMAGVEAILFDFDNTLQVGDKKELHARLKAVSENLNMGFSEEEIAKFGNRSDYREMRKMMVDAHNMRNQESPLNEDAFEEVNRKISGSLDHNFTLAKGAADLLKLLKTRGFKIGLVTTRGSNSLPRLLFMHGIQDHFDVIINRDDATEKKPHPEPISTALKRLGIEGPRAVFIGDKQVDDVIAGKALGMQTILICEDELDVHGAVPNYHCRSMRDVVKLFAHN